MNEPKGEKFDKYTAPTDTELGVLSAVLTQKIQEAVAANKLQYPFAAWDDDPWEFNIEGTGALRDDDGFVPSGNLLISTDDESKLPSSRTFNITIGRHLESEPEESIVEVYELILQKNTQVILGASRAVIKRTEAEELHQEYMDQLEQIRDSVEAMNQDTDQRPSLLYSIQVLKQLRDLEKGHSVQFRKGLNEKFLYGACNRAEVNLLVETLQGSAVQI